MLPATRRLILVFCLVLLLAAAGLAIWLLAGRVSEETGGIADPPAGRPADKAAPVTAMEAPPGPVYERLAGRYLVAGTIVWDRGVEESALNTDGVFDYEYPFKGLATYEPGSYDAWLADLECPVSEQDVPPELGSTLLEFNCRPEFLPFAAEYFQFFNLANNHSGNSGREALEETREALEEAGIQHFGDPEPDLTDRICEVVALPVRIQLSDGTSEQAGLPVAFCAGHYVFRLPRGEEMKVIEEYAAVMPVFVFLHMGAEYRPIADGLQESMAHQAIDAGAEFVIANNPHWVQNAELYKDKLIVYSTGNFIFDQAANEEVKQSANIIIEISADYDDELAAWLELAEECVAWRDNCLEAARQAGLAKPQLGLDFDVLAGYLTDNQQALADEEIQALVRQRLGLPEVFKAR